MGIYFNHNVAVFSARMRGPHLFNQNVVDDLPSTYSIPH